jgi:hypothetical protein
MLASQYNSYFGATVSRTEFSSTFSGSMKGVPGQFHGAFTTQAVAPKILAGGGPSYGHVNQVRCVRNWRYRLGILSTLEFRQLLGILPVTGHFGASVIE